MLAKRIIPCLDVNAGRVVKGVNFVELRDAGDPVEIARRYDEQGADELTFLDITASSDDRDIILHVIEQVADQVFIPADGWRWRARCRGCAALAQCRCRQGQHEHGGREQSATCVFDASDKVGSQCIVVAIDAKQTGPEKWEVFTHGGRKNVGLDVVEWAKQVAELGAGEILLTSMDRDGAKNGFDLELTDVFPKRWAFLSSPAAVSAICSILSTA